MQPLIKWTGSKRTTLSSLLPLFPHNVENYYEPFVGGGSVLYSVNYQNRFANDICQEVIEIFEFVQQDPEKVKNSYRKNWNEFQKDLNHYYLIRESYNKTNNPLDLLFLTRTSYNGLIRYNSNEQFNVGPPFWKKRYKSR